MRHKDFIQSGIAVVILIAAAVLNIFFPEYTNGVFWFVSGFVIARLISIVE